MKMFLTKTASTNICCNVWHTLYNLYNKICESVSVIPSSNSVIPEWQFQEYYKYLNPGLYLAAVYKILSCCCMQNIFFHHVFLIIGTHHAEWSRQTLATVTITCLPHRTMSVHLPVLSNCMSGNWSSEEPNSVFCKKTLKLCIFPAGDVGYHTIHVMLWMQLALY